MNPVTRGHAAVEHYRVTYEGPNEPAIAVSDLLADLKLWCLTAGIDWDEATVHAERRAREERHCVECGKNSPADLDEDLVCPACIQAPIR